jgi:hypothetical protein
MAKTLAPAPARSAAGAAAAPAQAQPLSFLQASEEVTEHFGQRDVQMLASAPVQLTDIKVPTFGWFRGLLLKVTASGGDAGLATVAAKADAPWSILQGLTLAEPNGRTLIGPISGYNLHLTNKWVPTYAWATNLEDSPVVSSTVDEDGNFTILYRMPADLGGREPVGLLANQQNDSRFKASFAIAPASVIYATAPDTLPTISLEWVYESFSPVVAATPEGAAVQAAPANLGTLNRLTVATPEVAAGNKRVPLTEVGNVLRYVLLVVRDDTGARSDSKIPDYLRFTRDTNAKDTIPSWLLKHYMWERTGMDPDTGVYVLFDGEHDLDGRSGQGQRMQWMRTSPSTRLEVEGEWKAGINSTLEVITNDVVPAPGLVQG